MSWNRRQFLTTSSLAIAASLIPGTAGFTRRAAVRQLREIRRNVGIFQARGGTIGWLASRAGSVVVDSQYPDTAPLFLDALKARGAGPIDALINSHHHADHTGGNAALRPVVRRIVAHSRVPALQQSAASASEVPQVYPDTTFDVNWMASVGDETVRATHYGAAHTAGDCTITFERANVVHMGDLVFHRVYPFVDIPAGASIAGWIELLGRVAAGHDADTIYIFGHSAEGLDVTGTRADVLLQRDFLTAVMDRAGRALAEGKSRAEATAIDQLPRFENYQQLVDRLPLSHAIAAAYEELRGAQ
jgi:cyclase